METPTLPADASVFTRLRTAVHALNVLKDDPTNTFYGPLLNACLDSETYAEFARDWRGSDAQALLDERPTLQGSELDLDALARLPPGTLGHEFVGYFRRNGIEPFVSEFPVESDVDYLSKRYRETHDLFHVITGYGTDELGEMELQAFVFGNLGLRQAAFIILLSLPHHLRTMGLREMPDYFRRLRAAYRRGRRSREMLSVRYENLWEQPVAALAESLCAPKAA
jgi:ubiquinone biosynthesis protein COQ4